MFEAYPYNYNPYFAQQMAIQYQQPQQIQGVKFVKDLQEAQNCSIPIGTKALFMNQNENIFYLKENDFNGVSNVTSYKFEEIKPRSDENYITREEFEKWKEEYEQSIQQSKRVADVPAQLSQRQPNGTTAEFYQNNFAQPSQGTGGATYPREESIFQ